MAKASAAKWLKDFRKGKLAGIADKRKEGQGWPVFCQFPNGQDMGEAWRKGYVVGWRLIG